MESASPREVVPYFVREPQISRLWLDPAGFRDPKHSQRISDDQNKQIGALTPYVRLLYTWPSGRAYPLGLRDVDLSKAVCDTRSILVISSLYDMKMN